MLGGSVQITRAGVISQPFPRFEHFFLSCLGKRGEGGEALKEREIKPRQDGVDLRLLQHDFAEVDAVWVFGGAPWQVLAAMGAIPAEERGVEGGKTGLGDHFVRKVRL